MRAQARRNDAESGACLQAFGRSLHADPETDDDLVRATVGGILFAEWMRETRYIRILLTPKKD